METILREVLAEDKSLLCRRDELIAALEKKIPPNKSRDFASIKRALSFNVGEKFFVGDDADREATKAEVAKILKDGGLQEARIDFVINTFVKALDWDKPKVLVPEEKSEPIKESESKNIAEIFKQAKAEQKSSTPPQQSPPKPSPPQPQPTKPTYQPPPKPTTPPQPAADTQAANKKNLLIGLACVAMLALFFVAGRSSNPSTSTTPPPVSSASNTQQTEIIQSLPEIIQNLPPSPPPEDTSYLNAQTDASLNGIDLGASVEQLVLSWGDPKQRKKRNDGNFTYIYDTIDVGVVEGKVHSFVTGNSKFKTLRGLHVGSTYKEVIDAYSTNSKDTYMGDLTLREYPFTSLDGKYSLLRFVINNDGRVGYIGIRIVEEDTPKKENKSGIDENAYDVNSSASASAPKKKDDSGIDVNTNEVKLQKKKDDSGIDVNTKQAAMAFLRFHEAITDKNYSAAFNLFSDERKENMNYDVQAFAKGYSTTITSEITDLKLVSTSNNYVVMDYVLDARDRAGAGNTLYQQFRGQVEMVKVGGEWKIAATQSKRIKEVMER